MPFRHFPNYDLLKVIKLQSFSEASENYPALKVYLTKTEAGGYSVGRVKLTMTLLHHLLHLPDHYKILEVYDDFTKKTACPSNDVFYINVAGPDFEPRAEGALVPEYTIQYRRKPDGTFEFDKFEKV